MEVLIVGAGAMGRWFAESVEADVAFADADPDAAAAAVDAVGGRTFDGDGEGALEPGDDAALESDGEGIMESNGEAGLERDDGATFDAVCLAVPMGAVESALERYAPLAERAVLDVTGEMVAPLSAMAERAPDRERVSLHPLFAPDRAPGQIAVVRDEPGPTTATIIDDLEVAGNEIVETTAAEHDDAMESVQAGAHAAILAFGLAAEPAPEGFETPVYAGLRRLVRRVTAGEPRVYGDVQRTFDGADEVAEAAARIADADDETFEALYRETASTWAADGSHESTGRTGGGDGSDAGDEGADAERREDDAERREDDADRSARSESS